MRRPSAEQLAEHWQLTTMPTENVRFSQTYVDARTGADGKPLCSAIIALLVDDPTVFSDMHRLPTDELWHFYLGDPIELLLLYSDGSDELVILGQDVPRRATHTQVLASKAAGGPFRLCLSARSPSLIRNSPTVGSTVNHLLRTNTALDLLVGEGSSTASRRSGQGSRAGARRSRGRDATLRSLLRGHLRPQPRPLRRGATASGP